MRDGMGSMTIPFEIYKEMIITRIDGLISHHIQHGAGKETTHIDNVRKA